MAISFLARKSLHRVADHETRKAGGDTRDGAAAPLARDVPGLSWILVPRPVLLRVCGPSYPLPAAKARLAAIPSNQKNHICLHEPTGALTREGCKVSEGSRRVTRASVKDPLQGCII